MQLQAPLCPITPKVVDKFDVSPARPWRRLSVVWLVCAVSTGCLADRASQAELEAAARAVETDGESVDIQSVADSHVLADADDALAVAGTDDAQTADDTEFTTDTAVADDVQAEDSALIEDVGQSEDTADTSLQDANVVDGMSVDDAGNLDTTSNSTDDSANDTSGQFCIADSQSCVGNVTALCAKDGTKWLPVDDCETIGLLCSAGSCVAKQTGFAGFGSFGAVPASASQGYRASDLRFGVHQTCQGGFCAVGGLRP